MRILILNEKYPPYFIGGYELFCAEVAELLERQGHDITVLTSDFGREQPGFQAREGKVHRLLKTRLLTGDDFEQRYIATIGSRLLLFYRNYFATLSFLRNRSFDLALCFKAGDTTFSPVAAAGRSGMPLVVFACDNWVELGRKYFDVGGLKKARRRLTYGGFDFMDISFARYLVDAQGLADDLARCGVRPDHIKTIYPITDLSRCAPREPIDFGQELRLFHGGRLCPEKGVEAFVDTVAEIARLRPGLRIRADIYGKGDDAYVAMLRRKIGSVGLDGVVSLRPLLPEAEFLERLGSYHFFVFPFQWDDPYPRTIVFAMASGVVTVCPRRAGAVEILRHGQTGLLLDPPDAPDPRRFAAAVLELVDAPERYKAIRAQAMTAAREAYDPTAQAQGIAAVLREAMEGRPCAS